MDYYKTIAWAEREHNKWMDSFAEDQEPLTVQDIVGDDDEIEDIK